MRWRNALEEALEAERCISWVCSLPGEWTTPFERLVLMVLATQGGEHHWTREDLARAVGERTDTLAATVHALSKRTATRPQLLRFLPRCPHSWGDDCTHRPGEALSLCVPEPATRAGSASP